MTVRPQLASIRACYGYPYHQWMTQEFDELGWKLVQKSLLQKRFHDVTLLIEGPDKRFALMSKHSYPPGVFRSPSGGVEPGEDLATGALREALEETGLPVDLRRFIHHITLDIVYENDVARWDSYIFYATTKETEIKPRDLKKSGSSMGFLFAGGTDGESPAGHRATAGSFIAATSPRLPSGLWTTPCASAKPDPRTCRPFPEPTASLMDTDARWDSNALVSGQEVNGVWAGTVGIMPQPDCVELTGLTVEPAYQTKGLGHALVEYVCDQWLDPEKRKRFAAARKVFLNDKLWLLTPTPAYFLPVNFALTSREFLPESLKKKLTGAKARWSAMRYQLYKL